MPFKSTGLCIPLTILMFYQIIKMKTMDENQITPEKAVLLLKKENIQISTETATAIIRFMYLLADIYLNEGEEI